MTQALTEPVCIVDGHHGIYVPQIWAQRYGAQAVESAHVSAANIPILLAGPDKGEPYWWAWECVLTNYCHEVDGVSHRLEQGECGDLFECPNDANYDESWED